MTRTGRAGLLNAIPSLKENLVCVLALGRIEYSFKNLVRVNFISKSANLIPKQVLGPIPKGKKACLFTVDSLNLFK